MTLTEALYRDSLLAWLRNRREYPFDNTPEPDMPHPWLARYHRIRNEVVRDFERTENESPAPRNHCACGRIKLAAWHECAWCLHERPQPL